MDLFILNAQLEALGELSAEVWIEWLWRSDPEEPLQPTVLLNRCHLLGLLLCRHQALVMDSRASPRCVDDRMRLLDKPPALYSLRELRDTLDNILIEWPQFIARLAQNPNADANLSAVIALADACFARLGALAATAAPDSVLDDPLSVDAFKEPDDTPPSAGHDEPLLRLSRPCLRRMLGSFLVLFRNFHLMATAQPPPEFPPYDAIRKHHIEASTDDFNMLCMHLALPTAARLNYRHDFPGMYNHVSQAVYFHNSQYERIPRVSFKEILTAPAVHIVPALWQLLPEIGVCYEEDAIDLSRPVGRWLWLVSTGRIYLVAPDSRVFFHESAIVLVGAYLSELDAANRHL